MGNSKRILVVGAFGQIGSELTTALRKRWGAENVVASDLRPAPSSSINNAGPSCICDVTDRKQLDARVDEYKIDTIVNMAAILSATGENNPQLCWHVNVDGLTNTLECAHEKELSQVFCPSSIAVFGPGTPDDAPQETVLRPTTMYGVTKVSGELMCDYYVKRFGVDVRGVRYPGIVSAETLPGGGTTDYAVDIFYKAIEAGRYTCFVKEDTRLPMMYMPDCLKATMDLMEAPLESLKHHSDFNIGAMSMTVGELAAEIQKHIPEFEITYKPDYRQEIADSWPNTVIDDAAREEWGWTPGYDLAKMTEDMLTKLKARHAAGKLYAEAYAGGKSSG